MINTMKKVAELPRITPSWFGSALRWACGKRFGVVAI